MLFYKKSDDQFVFYYKLDKHSSKSRSTNKQKDFVSSIIFSFYFNYFISIKDQKF